MKFEIENFFYSFLMWLRKLATVWKSLIFTMFKIVTVYKSCRFTKQNDFLTVTIIFKMNINDFKTVGSLRSHIKNERKSF